MIRAKSTKTKYLIVFAILTCVPLQEFALCQNALSGKSLTSQARPSTSVARGRHNGKIVFTSDRNYTGLSIWTMNADGSSPRRLTDDKSRTERLPSFVPVYDGSPAWSPDGTKIAFRSNRNYVFALYTMNDDGSNVKLVTDSVMEPARPVWSPDGRKIAFTAGIQYTFETIKPSVDIYVINPDGSGLTRLTSNSGVNTNPSWSPDGKQIVFDSNRDPDGRSKIWLMNADGTNQRRLTDIHNTHNPTFYGDSSPSWSPDGTKILFNGYRDFNGTRNCGAVNCSEIFVMNADGSNDRPLTNDPTRSGIFESPRWSPDGTKIVTSLALGTIARSVDLGRAVIVMNADGSNQINISNRRKYDFMPSEGAVFDVAPDWQALLTPSNSQSSVLGFSAASYIAYNDAGSFAITVMREGNLNDVASCRYLILDDRATVKYDFEGADGTLRFRNGEPSKIITLPVNKVYASGQALKIVLSDSDGNATFIGGNKEATVTFLDRDKVPASRRPD